MPGTQKPVGKDRKRQQKGWRNKKGKSSKPAKKATQ
jgi:hypothetical protein